MGPGMRSFSACLFSSARRALQCSHQTPRSEPGEEPPPLPEPGEPVPKPGEPPSEPGELVPMPGEAGPGEPVKEPGEEVPEPGDGVPEEPKAEPAPSGAGRLPDRDSSYAFRSSSIPSRSVPPAGSTGLRKLGEASRVALGR